MEQFIVDQAAACFKQINIPIAFTGLLQLSFRPAL